MLNEKKIRSIVRAVSWRILGTGVTFILVYFFTERADIAGMICGAEIIIKLILFCVHERVWARFTPGSRDGKSFVLWFTGLSGAGKSALADEVHDYLIQNRCKAARLDGDTVRAVFPDIGFTRNERNTHIQRVGYLASILEKNGVTVISSFVSPYAESRDFVRGLCRNFIEVFVDTPLAECERRDVKGLYKKARSGEIRNFTGIDDPYEPPVRPELTIRTENRTIAESAADVISYIKHYR